MAKREPLASARARYHEVSKKDKRPVLDEFIAITDHHRKHSIRPLQHASRGNGRTTPLTGRRLYGEAVPEAAIVVWELAYRICGKRQKARPHLVESIE